MKLRLIILGVLIGAWNFSDAQKLIFRNYTVEDGIAQSNANDIIQDREGYIWFATQKGACRFDGKEFITFSEKEGLISNITQCLLQDHAGDIWIGTRFGLSRYSNNTFTNYTVNEGLPSHLILQILEDEENTIWLATRNGVCRFNGKTFETLPLDKSVSALSSEPGGRLWIGAHDGLYFYDGKEITKSEIAGSENITDVIKDQKNNLWVSTENGVFQFDGKTTTKFTTRNGLPDNKIEDLMVDSGGNVWMASEGKGICFYDGEQFTYYNQNNGLTNLSVFKIFEDYEKNIWIGGRSGLTLLNRRIPFAHYEFNESLKDSDFFGMTQDANGDYWFTTYGDGIVKFDGTAYTRFNERNGLPDNRLFSALRDSQNNLWFSSAGFGIFRYEAGKFITYHDKGLGNKRVFKIIEDKRNDLWLATQGAGAVKFDGEKFIPISKNNNIPSDIIISVFEDAQSNIWLASVGDGVFKYIPDLNDPDTGRVVHFRNLKASFIRCIDQDQNGAIWIGSASHGVIRIIEGDTATYQYIGEADGLKSNNVYFMMFDSQNQLWVGTEKGLDKITLDENYEISSIKSYQREDGFIGIETTLNGVMEDNNGHLWFGTVAGVAKYLPEFDKPNLIPPKTHVKSLKLYYQETDWSAYSDSLNQNRLPVNLELPYDQNHLTFSFIGICMSNPEQVRYQFMLEGFDKTWSPVTAKNEAVYTSLPPGKYTFKVQARNDDLIWNTEPVSYAFVINPPIWQEAWFILSCIGGLFGLGFVGVRWRFYELERAKQRLATKVEERTVEIRLQKEEISRQKEAIEKIKEEIENKNKALELQNEKIIAQRDILSRQKAEIENKSLDITASINYAQRIQKAMLPHFKKINGVFEDLFILFKPKAIVSGDFYWFREKNGKYVIAAVDCTGHGIPGAFMAMIGDSLLSQIINQHNDLDPSFILKKLNEGVRDALNQNNNENTDGMDIALCVIDKQEKTLSFAGAKSPLAYFKNEELHFIKGDRDPIGAKGFESAGLYKTHTIPLTGDMVFYIFTDGYQDQFGGQNDKKFMISRLKILLCQIYCKPFEEQRRILNETLEKWKDGRDQVDDVLVIGFKIF